MHPSFLPLLCDPVTREDLRLEATKLEGDEVIEGSLVSSHATYPILRGIPRFVTTEGYSENFGYQWNKWSRVQFESDNVGLPMEGHTRRMFDRITELAG